MTECNCARQHVRKLLRKFRKTLEKDDSTAYCQARREYKNVLYRKKKDFNDTIVNELILSVKDQQTFRITMCKVSSRKSQPRNNVSTEDWFIHLKVCLKRK